MGCQQPIVRIPVCDFNHQLEKVVGSSVHSNDEDQRCLVTKPNGAHTQQFLHKNNELGKTLFLVTICLNKLCSLLVQLVNSLTALKKNPFICLGLGEKKAQRHIHGFQENKIEFLFL